MQNQLDAKYCLSIFNKVMSCGESTQRNDSNKVCWQGLQAWTDFDGYTCYLQFNDVTVTLMFHGKYAVESPNDEAWQAFIKKLQQVSTKL
ncbi:DUF3081 family protein [Colwellia sp. MEBiC06753]